MSKTKTYIKRTVKILSLLLAVVLVSGLCQEYLLCHNDQNRERIKGFYEEDKDSLDVVFVGSSEVYADFSSDLAYEEFGFTSYPVATAANVVSSYKTQIQEVRRTQNPKLIVLEINGAIYSKDEDLTKEGSIRKYIDNVPLNENKIEYVSDNVATDDQLEYYLPIVKYHSVWNDYPAPLKWVKSILSTKERGYNLLKGCRGITNVYHSKAKVINNKLSNDNKTAELNSNAEESLRELLQYLKDENIDNVLFVRFPHVVTKKEYNAFKRANAAGEIINEYGYEFINLIQDTDEIGLDVDNDFYQQDHLNIYGQQKFTKYFGNLLCDNYGITKTEQTDAQKEEWETSVDYYHRYYNYCDRLIKDGNKKEVGEDSETIEILDNMK
jgi:hypothetical protein